MFCAFLCYFYGRLFLILFLFRHCVGEQHVSQIARHIFGTDPLGKKRDSSEPGPDLPPHTVECDVEKKENSCENTHSKEISAKIHSRECSLRLFAANISTTLTTCSLTYTDEEIAQP